MNTITIRICGMHCDGCAERIKAVLEKTAGVREVSVSFALGQAEIRYNPHAVAQGQLAELVTQAGFGVESVTRA